MLTRAWEALPGRAGDGRFLPLRFCACTHTRYRRLGPPMLLVAAADAALRLVTMLMMAAGSSVWPAPAYTAAAGAGRCATAC
jgi:hypothetical protein